MYRLLEALTIPGVIVIFLGFIVGSIFLLRSIMNKSGEKVLATGVKTDEKKYKSVDLNKYNMLIGNIGWVLSIAVILAAFEFPDFEEKSLVDLGSLDAEMEELIEVPPTEQKPPPPPKVVQPQIVEVPDEEEIEEEIEIDLDVEIDEETVIEEVIVAEEAPEEEVADQIFEIVEEGATPQGGYEAFYTYVKKNLEYPKQAKRMGVEGKVYVQFVVDKDGSITDVKAIRGIGAGCDEEAVRVLSGAPKWNPGKQRGRAVRQRIVLPINFRLG